MCWPVAKAFLLLLLVRGFFPVANLKDPVPGEVEPAPCRGTDRFRIVGKGLVQLFFAGLLGPIISNFIVGIDEAPGPPGFFEARGQLGQVDLVDAQPKAAVAG